MAFVVQSLTEIDNNSLQDAYNKVGFNSIKNLKSYIPEKQLQSLLLLLFKASKISIEPLNDKKLFQDGAKVNEFKLKDEEFNNFISKATSSQKRILESSSIISAAKEGERPSISSTRSNDLAISTPSQGALVTDIKIKSTQSLSHATSDHWPEKIVYGRFDTESIQPLDFKEATLPPYDIVIHNSSMRLWLEKFIENSEFKYEDKDEDTFNQVTVIKFTNDDISEHELTTSINNNNHVKEALKDREKSSAEKLVFISIDDNMNRIIEPQQSSGSKELSALSSLRELVRKLLNSKEDICDKDFEMDVTYQDDPVDCDRFIFISWGDEVSSAKTNSTQLNDLKALGNSVLKSRTPMPTKVLPNLRNTLFHLHDIKKFRIHNQVYENSGLDEPHLSELVAILFASSLAVYF